MLKNNVIYSRTQAVGKTADLRPQGAVSSQKMRPPRVFWGHFGSRKRYARSYARDLKYDFWSSDQATVSSMKVDKSTAGTSPRYRFMVTMEPGTRQMEFFDTKLQMFENLNFVTHKKITNSQIETPDHLRESVGIISEGMKRRR